MRSWKNFEISIQNEIVKRFEHKIIEQNAKIEELESKLAMKQTDIDNFEIKCDGKLKTVRTYSLHLFQQRWR